MEWDISAYRANIHNELQCLTTGIFNPCSIVNAHRTVHQGVEAGLGMPLAQSVFDAHDRFQLNMTYRFNDFFFDGDSFFDDNELPGVARHNIRAEIQYRRNDGFYLGPEVEWVPQSYFADNSNTLEVEPFALLNFKMGYDNDESGWSGYIEGRNLLDKRYISAVSITGTATTTSELFNPGNGRAVYAGVRFRF